MTEDIIETIKKLELYQQQIKEHTKLEIVNMVELYVDDYFLYNETDAVDSCINKINYFIDTFDNIQKIIYFLNINYDPEFLKKFVKDNNNSRDPITKASKENLRELK